MTDAPGLSRTLSLPLGFGGGGEWESWVSWEAAASLFKVKATGFLAVVSKLLSIEGNAGVPPGGDEQKTFGDLLRQIDVLRRRLQMGIYGVGSKISSRPWACLPPSLQV